jgi:hypothetical protein
MSRKSRSLLPEAYIFSRTYGELALIILHFYEKINGRERELENISEKTLKIFAAEGRIFSHSVENVLKVICQWRSSERAPNRKRWGRGQQGKEDSDRG